MKFYSKNYNLQKTQNFFRTQNFFLVFMLLDINFKTKIKQKRFFLKHDLILSIFSNYACKIFLKQSIFKNLDTMITGSIVFLHFNKLHDLTLKLKDLMKINNKELVFLGIQMNKNFYYGSQIKTSFPLNYKSNIKIFHKFLVTNLIFSYSKLLCKKSK